MNCPYFVKVCTKCGKLLMVCNMNFYKGSGKYGYRGQCKECTQQYYEENKEGKLEYQNNYYEEHKEQIAEYKKQYREENKEKRAEYMKQYYEENKEERLEYMKQYYEENKEERLEYQAQYGKNNPHIQFNNNNKRRQLEENQGNGVTKEQWYEMFCFFNWECAYSGIQLNENNRTVDHIIALDNEGLNEAWNCVPCYSSYNYSKHTKNMEIWYRQQEYFSEERLAKIYEWCEYAYSKWGVED